MIVNKKAENHLFIMINQITGIIENVSLEEFRNKFGQVRNSTQNIFALQLQIRISKSNLQVLQLVFFVEFNPIVTFNFFNEFVQTFV
jgi:hypothetical protein